MPTGVHKDKNRLVDICTSCKRELPIGQFNWKDKTRGTRRSWCKDCIGVYLKNPKVKATQAAYAKTPKRKASHAVYMSVYEKTPKRKAYSATHAKTPKVKATQAAYRKNNPEKMSAKAQKRRAAKLRRLPKWADLNTIKQIYVNRPKGMVVDHIIPLRGKLVSGLHVENNLQYLTKRENDSKGNKFDPIEYNKSLERKTQ